MQPYQIEKAAISVVAFFMYPANSTKTALYHNSKLYMETTHQTKV